MVTFWSRNSSRDVSNEGVEASRSVLLHGVGHVDVEVQRHANVRETEAFLHDLRMHPILQHQGGTGMPKVVKANRGQASQSDEPLEALCQRVWVYRSA